MMQAKSNNVLAAVYVAGESKQIHVLKNERSKANHG